MLSAPSACTIVSPDGEVVPDDMLVTEHELVSEVASVRERDVAFARLRGEERDELLLIPYILRCQIAR